MKRAARVRTRSSTADVWPLDAPASALLVGDTTLVEHQGRSARAAGYELVDVEVGAERDGAAASLALPGDVELAFAADCTFSAETLRALVASAGGDVVHAHIAPGSALHEIVARTASASADTGRALPLGLYAGRLGARVVVDNAGQGLALTGPVRPVSICDEVTHDVVRVPPHGPPPHVLRIPRVARFGARVAHWLDVLDVNLALLRVPNRTPALATLKPRPRVHPTAYVARSSLGAGVVVEAHASVIDSVLHEGVLVADHSVIVDSVIGAGCRTLVDTHLRRVVAMPGSTLSNLKLEDTVLGREVFVTTGVAFFQPLPGTAPRVERARATRAVVGGAVGARAVLGSRALFAAGTAVPPRVLVVMRPEEGVSKIDATGLARAAMRFGDPRRDA